MHKVYKCQANCLFPRFCLMFLAVLTALFFSGRANGASEMDLVREEQKTPVIGSKKILNSHSPGQAAKVYFSPVINEEMLIKLYNLVNENIQGKTAIKLHTGERHGPNILPPSLVKALQAVIPDSSIVETNTAYVGDRDTTAKHRETLEVNGWTFCPVDILDEDGDVNLPVMGGLHLKEVAMGRNILNYDSMLVLTHFKGHASGGFGGSMKNIAIGCASGKLGKRQVHDVKGDPPDWNGERARKDAFMERMADSAKAITNHFGEHIAYINILRNMSIDCDCMGVKAEKPVVRNIGILASTDLLAIDQAACDLVFGLPEMENRELVERIQSRHGLRQLSAMAELKLGKPMYELIVVE